ncbi:hypothetical protein INT45_000624 [Circinella minor]|uniref:Uncharacterized protein n=1 Tax=Circinella minor TaxID=1195481 RepID=A0A8H7RRH3_9FUNG|nr:hypothetical protein INT45_000624 [Circinella minor]
MILAKLDHLESKIDHILASKDQVGEALEEHVEEASDNESPVDFVRQLQNSQGKVRNAKIADVDAAILALSNMDNSTKMLKMADLEAHVTAAIKRMTVMVGDKMAGQPWSSQSHEATSFIMKLFTESVSKGDLWIPIQKCENNWMARFLLLQKWSNANKKKVEVLLLMMLKVIKSVVTVGSEESREIIRQFSGPGTSSSGPSRQPPILTQDASITSSTMSIARKRLSSSLSINDHSNNNNRAAIRRRTMDKSG